uniref:TPM domain-containing protein n=1 Tax=Fulvivirga sp. TaxID=1931237 RepID=UPI00404931CE
MAAGQIFSEEGVPNPKSKDGGYISDPNQFLNPETYSTLNQHFARLEDSTSVQVALVVLSSIGDEVPKDFAYSLFNNWGVGVKGKDNGLLILLVVDQRRVEFETGYGLESLLTDATCKSIQMKYMVPQFKNEDYDAGLLDGVNAIIEILQNGENSQVLADLKAEEPDEKSVTTIVYSILLMIGAGVGYLIKKTGKGFSHHEQGIISKEDYKLPAISRNYWLLLYFIIPAILLILVNSLADVSSFFITTFLVFYLYLSFLFAEKWIRKFIYFSKQKDPKDNYSNYNFFQSNFSGGWWKALFFPFPFIIYLLWQNKYKNHLRNAPRHCVQCNSNLEKLSEMEEDDFLTQAQMLEEDLKSVDYDVWLCRTCLAHEILSYKKSNSKYETCSRCKTKAYYLQNDKTLVSATYSSTGTGEKTYNCKFCNHTDKKSYAIPMLTASDSSSSGSGGGGSSSYGGGSSGGGGSGSSW